MSKIQETATPEGAPAPQLGGAKVSTLRKVCISAIFLSLALIFKLVFTVSIPLFGDNGMRVGLTGIFTAFPAVLFGPLYGGVCSALSDFLGCMIKPTGAYIPWFTVAAFIGGFLKGLIWRGIRDKNEKGLRIAITVLIAAAGVLGLVNFACIHHDGLTQGYFGTAAEGGPLTFVSRLLTERAAATSDPAGNLAKYCTYMTWGLLVFSILGLIIMVADWIFAKRLKREGEAHSAFKIMVALVVSGLVTTTINTEVLRLFVYSSWRDIAFFLLWLPRAIEEVVVCVIQAYFVTILYRVLIDRLHLTEFALPKKKKQDAVQ